MSATLAAVLVVLILWVFSLWVLHARLRGRDDRQQEQLNAIELREVARDRRADGLANRLDMLERDRFDDAARRLDDDARRLEDRKP